MPKRTTLDFSDGDLEMLHAIMERHHLTTEAAAIRWALHTMAKATEIVLKSQTGEIVRYTREGSS